MGQAEAAVPTTAPRIIIDDISNNSSNNSIIISPPVIMTITKAKTAATASAAAATRSKNDVGNILDDDDDDFDLDIEDLHLKALQNRQKTYIDPETGFTVFTEMLHLKRGTCCGNRCRHCPYGHENVYIQNTTTTTTTTNTSGEEVRSFENAKVRSGDFDEASRLYQGILNGDEDVIQYLTRSTAAAATTTTASSSSSRTTQIIEETSDNAKSTESGDVTIAKPTTAGNANKTAIETKSKTDKTSLTAATTSKSPTTAKNVPYTRGGDGGTSQLLSGERRSKCDCNFEALGTVDELCTVVGVAHALLVDRMSAPAPTQAPDATNNSKNASSASYEYGNLPTLLLEVMSRLFDIGSHVAKPRISPRPTHDSDGDVGDVGDGVDGDGDCDVNDSNDRDTGSNNINQKNQTKSKFVSNGVGDGFDPRHIDDLEVWIDEMTEDLPELTSFILPTGATAAAQLHVARTTCRRAERRVVPLVVDDQTCDPNALRYLNRLSDFFFVAARWVNFCEGKDEIQYRRQGSNNTQRERVHRSLN